LWFGSALRVDNDLAMGVRLLAKRLPTKSGQCSQQHLHFKATLSIEQSFPFEHFLAEVLTIALAIKSSVKSSFASENSLQIDGNI